MRALAHPLRLRILEEMWDEDGPLRAADLAARLAEPANSVSYHLRRLRDTGYVVEVTGPEGSTARDRWYRAPDGQGRAQDAPGDPDEAERAVGAMLRSRYGQVAERLLAAQGAQDGPLLHINGTVWLPEELAAQFVARLADLAHEMRDAAEQARLTAAEDTEFTRYTVVLDCVPEVRHGERLMRPTRRVPDGSHGGDEVHLET